VWELSPANGTWAHSVLYSFSGGADGGEPYKGVTLDARGKSVRHCGDGGSGGCEGGCGVVYALTNSGGTWTQTVVHAFTGGDDGAGPGAGLTIDANGDIYGTTPSGGAYGQGTIFRLHRGNGGSWKLKVIHAFHRRLGRNWWIGGPACAFRQSSLRHRDSGWRQQRRRCLRTEATQERQVEIRSDLRVQGTA